MSHTTTFAFSEAHNIATALPMTEPAPVTMGILFSKY